MHYARATFQYDGTDYCGFQWQSGLPTVQDELNKALARVVGGKCSTAGTSRTDTGVHAHGQVVKLTAEKEIAPHSLPERLNDVLPSSIRCLEASPCSGDFNPAVHSASKEYRYYFTNEAADSSYERRFISNIGNPLDLAQMRACAQSVQGEHDFRNFHSAGSNVRSTVRHVMSCQLSLVDPYEAFSTGGIFQLPPGVPECFELRIIGKGFLKQMVRHLVGAMWMVGSGKLTPAQFTTLLHGPPRGQPPWRLASPKGLHLWRITQVSP